MFGFDRLVDCCLDHPEMTVATTAVESLVFSQMVIDHTGDLVQRQADPMLGGGPQPEWRAQIETGVDVAAPRDHLSDLRLPLGDGRIAVVVRHHAARLPKTPANNPLGSAAPSVVAA